MHGIEMYKVVENGNRYGREQEQVTEQNGNKWNHTVCVCGVSHRSSDCLGTAVHVAAMAVKSLAWASVSHDMTDSQ